MAHWRVLYAHLNDYMFMHVCTHVHSQSFMVTHVRVDSIAGKFGGELTLGGLEVCHCNRQDKYPPIFIIHMQLVCWPMTPSHN